MPAGWRIGFSEVMAVRYGRNRVFAALMGACLVYVCVLGLLRGHAAETLGGVPPVCVVIDAGHGGEDGGAVSADGTLESTINLQIALRVRDLLTFCGVRTRMIRETDTAVYTPGSGTVAEKKRSDLQNRVRTVNETPGALLLSIHQNFFPQTKYHGAQVFYAPTDGSDVLAARVQETLRAAAQPENGRRCKPAESVYLMQNITCTGILVECGFLSNAQEAARLREAGWQKKLTTAICGALCGYLAEEGNANEV